MENNKQNSEENIKINSQIDKQKQKEEKKKDFLDILKIFSPGTALRLALDDILRARMGALIVIDNDKLSDIMEQGFKVNTKFSAQKIVELAKMDGAIILSHDLKKIIHANAVLFPNINIPSRETGTRHKAAERTAKELHTTVVAVSERKNKITIYYSDKRYELKNSSEILRRAAESLQILEKQKEILNDLMINLNILEINNLVTISDISTILQRIEVIKRISETIKRDLVELGKEGIIVSTRLKELTKNLNKEREMMIRDYFNHKYVRIESILSNIKLDILLETSDLSKLLFEEVNDKSISPKGIRILDKTNLKEKEIKALIKNFKTLDKIFEADKDALIKVLRNEETVKSLKEDLESLREKIVVGKKI